MDSLNAFDIVALVIVLASSLFGFWYGLVRETMTLVSWLIAAVLAYIVAPWAYSYIEFVPLVGPIVSGTCELGVVSAYIVVFAVILLLLSLTNVLLARMVQQPVLHAFDSSGGLLFGAFRGLILVSIILLITETVVPARELVETVLESQSNTIFRGLKSWLVDLFPTEPPAWLDNAYQNLMASCSVQTDTLTRLNPMSWRWLG